MRDALLQASPLESSLALFSLPLLQRGVSGPSVPMPPGEGHNLTPHSVWKLGLQTTLICALEITN